MVRKNDFIESYKALRENNNRLAEIRENAIKEAAINKENFMKDYYSLREGREIKQRQHGVLMEACRDNAFATVLKAIYITALEANTLTDDGILLAESMVDNWIKENGGANKILTETQGNSYLLARIAQIVEEAAILETEEVENSESDNGETSFEDNNEDNKIDDKDNETEEKSEVMLATKVIEKNLDTSDEEVIKAIEIIKNKANSVNSENEEEKESSESDNKNSVDDNEDDNESVENSEENKEETSTEESDSEENKEDNHDDTLNDTFDEDEENSESTDDENDVEIPDDATTDSDDNETDIAEDITDDLEEVPEEDITVDGNVESNGKVFDELEKEEDVKKAIELIRQRVADAEETFIKRNAEDKKQIDELIGRISDNVKTVEDINNNDKDKSEVAQEAVRLNKQKINEITENRPLTVMEKMCRNLQASIVKEDAVREKYITESGNIDTGLIVEAGKVMYGFLETINTLKLAKVDNKYIENILENM